ncbi:MAG: 3-keto-5-aminohexanoate cleavage protein [Beijerinckiaceae bacterium]|nr:3-keto-5-aminohexanoate cleavage protein [Beijerinckiaceae bacterium]
MAITGSFVRRDKNPNQPYTPEEIRASAREVLLAGASTVHIHVRDENGYFTLDPDRFREVIEPLKAEFPDLAVDGCLVCGLPHDWPQFEKTIDTGLLDASPVNSTATYIGDSLIAKPAPILLQKTRMLLERGIVPEIAVYTDGDISNADRYLIRSGLIGPGAVWLLLPALPGCSPMNNTRQMAEGLLRMSALIRDVDPDAVIVVCAAGRASSALAMLAVSLGFHIRIGMEDTYYLHPHKDDLIQSNLQTFEMAMQMAAASGRRVATRAEYKALLDARRSASAATVAALPAAAV